MKEELKLREVFGRNLKVLSENTHSKRSLAAKLGVSRTQLDRYLTGKSSPKPEIVKKVCDLFDVDPSVLIEPIDLTHAKPGPAPSSSGLAEFLNGHTDFFGLHDFFKDNAEAVEFQPGWYKLWFISPRTGKMYRFIVFFKLDHNQYRWRVPYMVPHEFDGPAPDTPVRKRSVRGVVVQFGGSFLLPFMMNASGHFGVMRFNPALPNRTGYPLLLGSYIVFRPNLDPVDERRAVLEPIGGDWRDVRKEPAPLGLSTGQEPSEYIRSFLSV